MSHVIALIENTFGFPLTDSNVARISKLLPPSSSFDYWEFFQELNELLSDPVVPERVEAELRPLIGYSFTGNVEEMVFYDVNQTGIDVEYFKKLLIYYHRVYLVIHTEFGLEQPTRKRAAEFIRLIHRIKPLVEKNIINFVREEVLNNVDPQFRDYFAKAYGHKIGGFVSVTPDAPNPLTSLAADLNGSWQLDLDYVTTQRQHWDLVVGSSQLTKSSRFQAELTHFWSTSLLEFDLPNLADLQYADIIAIRDNADAFAEWRTALEEMFARVQAQCNDPEKLSDEVHYYIRHAMSEKAAGLRKEINQSSLKHHLKSNGLLLTLDLIGIILTQQFVDIDPLKKMFQLSFSAKGISGLLPPLLRAASGNDRAIVQRHYSLFEEKARS
jgi:hypothetical protein